MKRKSSDLTGLYALARRQHGCVSRDQVLRLGFGRRAVEGMLDRGALRQEVAGVYAVGGSPSTFSSRVMVAVLSCGPTAFASHLTSARVQGMLRLPRSPADESIEVTVPDGERETRGWVRISSMDWFESRDRRLVDGIPVASPALTLLGLSARHPYLLEEAFDQAWFHELIRMPQLFDVVVRAVGMRGVRGLRELMEVEREGKRLRLEAEKRFAKLLRNAGLPQPVTNERIGSYVVDFLWERERLVVEVDSWGRHRQRAKFESDRARDADLIAKGYRVIRVTWRQITSQPDVVAARIASALDVDPARLVRPGNTTQEG